MAANDITCHVPAVPAGARAELLDTQTSPETALDILCTWFMQNGMMVNASKTGVGDVVCAAPRCRVVRPSPQPLVAVGRPMVGGAGLSAEGATRLGISTQNVQPISVRFCAAGT